MEEGLVGRGCRNEYAWSVAGTETPLNSERDLDARLAEVAQTQGADWAVLLNDDSTASKSGWVYRLLGLKPPVMLEGVLVCVNGGDALFTYVDQDWNETRATDPERATLTGDVVFTLSAADSESVPRAETVRREDAIDAVRRFFGRQGRRPEFVYTTTE
jgi:hypothetical protein